MSPARTHRLTVNDPDPEPTMSRMLFINLATADAARSKAFFTDLGFEINETFCDAATTCVMVNDQAAVMLLETVRFKDFTKKDIVDSTSATEAIIAFSADSRDQVDSIAEQALAGGGSPANEPQDHGFMYGRSFQDLDGHLWELMWMDPAQMPAP